MFVAMKRLLASLAVLVFAVGMLVLPVLHRQHCSHHEADCPVCQLANAPLDAANPLVAPGQLPLLPALAEVYFLAAPVVRLSWDATQPRAPPPA